MDEETESQALRMKMRIKKRSEHVEQIFSQKRAQYMEAERKEYIQLSEGLNGKTFLREDQIKKVWNIIFQSKEKCPGETSILFLINVTIKDVHQIIKMEIQKEEQKKELSDRICANIEFLSSQIYENSSLSDKIILEIVHICLTIIKHEFECSKTEAWDQAQQRNRYETPSHKFSFTHFDEYIIGCCVIALANSCKNAKIVEQILKEIKISDLTQILNLMLDSNNLLSLTLLIQNFLLNYPEFMFSSSLTQYDQEKESVEKSTNYMRAMLIYDKQKLQFSLVLEYICQKIRENLLFSVNNLSQGQSPSFQSLQKSHQSNSCKNRPQLEKGSKSLQESWPILNNLQQKKGKKKFLKNAQQKDQSQSILTDLTKCMAKLEFISVGMRQKKQKICVPPNLPLLDENQDAQMNKLTQQINKAESRISEIKSDIVNLSFRKLYLNFKCYNKDNPAIMKEHFANKEIIQLATFVSELLRSVHWSQIKERRMEKNLAQKQEQQERILGEKMEFGSVMNMLEQIHCFVNFCTNTNLQQIDWREYYQMNSNSLWKIYEYLMNLIQCKVSKFIESEKQEDWECMMRAQLLWLQRKLTMRKKGDLPEQQEKNIISLLVNFYPYIKTTYHHPQQYPGYQQHFEVSLKDLWNIVGILHSYLIDFDVYSPRLLLCVIKSIRELVEQLHRIIFDGQGNIIVQNELLDLMNADTILGAKFYYPLMCIQIDYYIFQPQYDNNLNVQICGTIDQTLKYLSAESTEKQSINQLKIACEQMIVSERREALKQKIKDSDRRKSQKLESLMES